jgi:transcriptional regulator with XRE-family HTH domain
MNFGAELKKLRLQEGVSVAKLSELTGVTFGTIYSLERGDKKPSLATASVLLEPLGYELKITKKGEGEQ